MNKILRAVVDMQRAHAGQKRLDGSEYWFHPYRVMGLMLDADLSTEDECIAALFHDTLEDTDVTESYIAGVYGTEVLDIVKALTKPKEGTWIEKTRTKIAACKKNKSAMRVYFYDASSNIQDYIKYVSASSIDGFPFREKKEFETFAKKLATFEFLLKYVFVEFNRDKAFKVLAEGIDLLVEKSYDPRDHACYPFFGAPTEKEREIIIEKYTKVYEKRVKELKNE